MRVSWFLSYKHTIEFDYFSPICTKIYFSAVNVEKLAKPSRTTLLFRRVSLWRHDYFTGRNGWCSLSSTPCGWQAGHSRQVVWMTLYLYVQFQREIKSGFCSTRFPRNTWYWSKWYRSSHWRGNERRRTRYWTRTRTCKGVCSIVVNRFNVNISVCFPVPVQSISN